MPPPVGISRRHEVAGQRPALPYLLAADVLLAADLRVAQAGGLEQLGTGIDHVRVAAQVGDVGGRVRGEASQRLLHVTVLHVRMRIGRQFARQARNITEVRVLFGEAVEIFAVQQFAGAARALQQHDLHAALGHRRFQQRQHRAVRGDAGAGGDQQVAAVVVTGIQAEAAVGAGRADLATVLQCLEQGRGGAAGHEADRDIHRLARAQRVVVDGRQRITALGLGAVGVAEMDLDELAGLKIQRLSVITHELVVADGRGQHAAADQLEGELNRHDFSGQCVAGASPRGRL
ncbi:hypothetical protein G6F31_013770 [Rhizopus arrhizus]|nr:hypothetical protein G6F31_013770 [Rhizopus arrhizus]